MNAVMIIPTGIGCMIGGHAGDATPAAKLIAACCDKLILHPNVVNASDINEMPPNSLYVEGSMLDRFLEGEIQLQEVRQNRILVASNGPVRNETINAVSAARATIGAEIEVLELRKQLCMKAIIGPSGAAGSVTGWKSLVRQVTEYDFDALAIASFIECDKSVALGYYRNGGINPWGGVEAVASRLICQALNKPVAHAPIENTDPEIKTFNEIVDPRIAAEAVSTAYLHCVLKGLHRAPRIGAGLCAKDIDFLISPFACWGRPHEAALRSGITIVNVKENRTVLNKRPLANHYIGGRVVDVENYLEAAGIIMASRAGIDKRSVRRPLRKTEIIRSK